MKKFIYFIISTLCMLIIISCNYKTTSVENKNKSYSVQTNEEFNSFLHEFYSDSIFQLNRIIFPLESDKETNEEYLNALKDSGKVESIKNNYISHTKNNWETLSDTQFKNDSIATIDGIKYKRRFYKTNNLVEENILYAEDELVMIVLKFKLINNKWYLFYFKDGFADE